MIRVIGILVGSALAVAAIVVTVGLPELTRSKEVSLRAQPPVEFDPPATDDAVPGFVAQPGASPDADINVMAASEEALPAATADEGVTSAVAPTVAPPVAAPVAEAAAETVLPAPAAMPSQNWYAFWSPFRSEIAADGFITELQRTTGLDYRVVKLKPGVYEVAFAYSDPLDRDAKLERIVSATGLDMSGG